MKNDQMYLHPEVETLSRPDIEKLQLKRLKATINRCMHSPFYKERFQQCGIKPEDIQSLEDLQKIPFTTKQDLRDHYPFGLSAVPLEEVVRLHSSSGYHRNSYRDSAHTARFGRMGQCRGALSVYGGTA